MSKYTTLKILFIWIPVILVMTYLSTVYARKYKEHQQSKETAVVSVALDDAQT